MEIKDLSENIGVGMIKMGVATMVIGLGCISRRNELNKMLIQLQEILDS